MLSEIILRVAGFEQKDSKYYPRPSLAGPERCTRQMVYWGLNFPKQKMTDRFIVVMEDSSWHEQLTLDLLRKSAFMIHSEQMEISCPTPMTKGSIDAIFTDLFNTDYLLEHKALNHFSWERYWKTKEIPEDYFTQLAIYLWGIKLVNPDINKGILFIKNKNTSQYMEYLCEYDKDKDILKVLEMTDSMGKKQIPNTERKDIVKNAVDKFNLVQDYINKKTLPKRDYSLDNWRCQYCSYQNICQESYEEEFKDLKDNIELSQDIEERLAYYLELKTHLLEMKKEQDGIKDEVKAILLQHNAKQAKTERYIIDLALIKSERVDKDKIPPDILSQVLTSSLSERLNIKLRKEKK